MSHHVLFVGLESWRAVAPVLSCAEGTVFGRRDVVILDGAEHVVVKAESPHRDDLGRMVVRVVVTPRQLWRGKVRDGEPFVWERV